MGSHTLFKKRNNMVHTRKTATKLHAFLSFFKRRMIDKKNHQIYLKLFNFLFGHKNTKHRSKFNNSIFNFIYCYTGLH